MAKRACNSVQQGSYRYVSPPQNLLQALIRGSDKIRYQVCWQEAEPWIPDLMTDAYKNSEIHPIYIRAIQGHSGATKVDINKMSAWDVNESHAEIYCFTQDGATI